MFYYRRVWDAGIVLRNTLIQARRCNTGKNSKKICVFHVGLAIIQRSIPTVSKLRLADLSFAALLAKQ